MSETIVVFEGINGSGKSVQARRLKESLEEAGKTCVIFRDPGSTPLGTALRSILKGRDHDIDPLTQTLLFTAARRALLPVIESSEEDVVILDRWWFSTEAYQGAQCVERWWIKELVKNCSPLNLDPGLCFLLDVDPEIAGGRIDHVRILQGVDRFEAFGLEFQRKVGSMYRYLVPTYLTLIDCQGQTEEDVAKDILGRVMSHLESESTGA